LQVGSCATVGEGDLAVNDGRNTFLHEAMLRIARWIKV
jgi:hypothetical protein